MKRSFAGRKRLFIASPLILTGVAVLCVGVGVGVFYNEAIRQRKTQLISEAAEQIVAIREIARANDWDPHKTLDQFHEMRGEEYAVVGQTGEFIIGERDGEKFRDILRCRSVEQAQEPHNVHADFTEPLRRALNGETGAMFGVDNRGQKVLAAYMPVTRPRWGFVVKIDARELWSPLLKTTAILGTVTLFLVFGGSLAIVQLGRPMIRDLEAEVAANRKAQDALRQSRDQLQTICDEMAEGMVITDVDTKRFVNVNASYCRMVGFTREEILRRSLYDVLLPEAFSDELKCYESIVAGDASLHEGRPVLRKDGSVFFADIMGRVINYGGRRCLLAMMRDMTERRHIEREIVEARRIAEAASNAKSEFLANMSHEIRTPMTAILGYSESLLSATQNPETVEAVQIIKRNAHHLLAIINDILDLSKIETGRMDVSLTTCPPRQILGDVMDTMRVHADIKKIALSSEVQESVPQLVKTDPIRLRQILMNLVGNAIKFTASGSVQVNLWVEESDPANCRLRFDVIDTGIGLSEDQIVGLFQPFSQADTSSQRRYGGVGLGLAISQRLARLLGGDIRVVSEVGKGSTFSVTVLAAAAIGGPSATTFDAMGSPNHAPRRTGRLFGRILLAEDGPDNQRLISTMLRKAGAEVECVDNGEKATNVALSEQMAGSPFDLIVMDMQMPVMDGYEAVQKLREAGYVRPIIALTAHAMKEDREKCINAGCDDYLTKPIDREAFLGVVAEFLTRSFSDSEEGEAVAVGAGDAESA